MEFDAEFSRKYEEAISDLSEDDLEFVASLTRDRLNEYVYSPARIRPLKLKKWREDDTAPDHDLLNSVINKFLGVQKEELFQILLDLLPPRSSKSQDIEKKPTNT
jgi:hypothetical protein